MLPDHVVSVALYRLPPDEIDVAPEDRAEILLHRFDVETRFMSLLELHQHVHVAVGAEVVAEHRPEQVEPPDVVPAAELGDPVVVDFPSSSAIAFAA